MEKKLEKIYLETVRKINKKKNKMEFLTFPGKYFEYMVKEPPIVIFNEAEKYAEFNEEYIKNASSMKEFSKLISYLKNIGYKTNLN